MQGVGLSLTEGVHHYLLLTRAGRVIFRETRGGLADSSLTWAGDNPGSHSHVVSGDHRHLEPTLLTRTAQSLL